MLSSSLASSLPAPALKYVLLAFEGTPDVLEGLLQKLAPEDPIWDRRPDPERFTIREVLAHIADWEPIVLERVCRIRDEETPLLPDVDENAMAVKNDYAHSDPRHSLTRIHAGRAHLLATLRALPTKAWQRTGNRESIGLLTLQDLIVMWLGHDGYHTCQIAQWLTAL